MAEDSIPVEAQFNQAAYQQQRINELLLRVDRLSINPIEFNFALQTYNYKVIFNDLCSVLLTISSKLEKKEKEDIIKFKSDLNIKIDTEQIFIQVVSQGLNSRKVTMFKPQVWKEINELLFEFRIKLEGLMDLHGYGNPSKDDPRSRFGKG